MKASHYITPRTLSECNFALNADPVERFENEDAWGRHGMGALIAILIVALVIIVATR